MLTPPDLSGFDLEDLSAGLLSLTQRQHRCLRQANHITDSEAHPGLATEIDNLDRDAASAAEAHRLVSLLRRFAADEGHARRPGLFARALAHIGRPQKPATPETKKGEAA